MEKIQVVAAIIRNGTKFLLGKRSPSKKSAPGYWSPISGKIEPGESQEDAVVRECFEEVGLVVEPVKKTAEFDIDQGRARLHWWTVAVISGRPFLNNDEHTELRWFSVPEMKESPDFFAEDIEVFEKLLIA